MKLAFLALLLVAPSALAATYVVPKSKMDDVSTANVISSIHELITKDGTYTSLDSSGQVCGLIVSSHTGSITLSAIKLNHFSLETPVDGEYWHYLLAYSAQPQDAQGESSIHLVISTQQQETQAFLSDITITSKNGLPTSIQVGLAGPHGGSNILPGDVYTEASFGEEPICNNLVLK